jgi:hypothetical protein
MVGVYTYHFAMVPLEHGVLIVSSSMAFTVVTPAVTGVAELHGFGTNISVNRKVNPLESIDYRKQYNR